MSAIKKILVTGGAGFIGSHFVCSGISSDCCVMVIDNFSTGKLENLDEAKLRFGKNLLIVDCDINSEEAIANIMDFRPDAIYHLAGQVSARESVDNPTNDLIQNTQSTAQLAHLCSSINVKLFVYASSAAVYGDNQNINNDPCREFSSFGGISPYAVSKYASEKYLDMYSLYSKTQFVSLRFSNVYGERQNIEGEAGVVPIFLNRLLNNEKLLIYGDGCQFRDFINVRDVVSGLKIIMDNYSSEIEGSYNCFNLCYGVSISIIDLAEECLKLIGVGTGERFNAIERDSYIKYEKERVGDIKVSSMWGSKFRDYFHGDWRPHVTLEDGLVRLWEYLKDADD